MSAHDVGVVSLRFLFCGVYLFAWYRNVQNSAARSWTVTHTALLLNIEPDLAPKQLSKLLAKLSMAVMLVGSLSVLVGLEARIGAIALALFTTGGILQHRQETRRAHLVADRLDTHVSKAATAEVTELRWSAFAGNFSSGLKNWALVGVCIYFVLAGAGPWSVCDYTGQSLFPIE